jgi:hypothetical protein
MAGQIDFIRFAADTALTVPALLSLRPYTVTLNTVTWSGDRPGVGTRTLVTRVVTNGDGVDGDGYVNPRFRQVSKQDIVLSGGFLKDQDVVIGPFVFPYNTGTKSGGLDPLVFSPSSSTTDEFYINIQGPNFPAGGVNYKKIWDNSERNVMYRIYMRATSAIMP